MEGADEIGEIAETDIIGDIGDGAILIGQKPRRMAQPRAHQILVRGDAEHAANSLKKWNGLMAAWRLRLPVDFRLQFASIHSAVSTARRRSRASTPLCATPRRQIDKTACEDLADLVEADVAFP